MVIWNYPIPNDYFFNITICTKYLRIINELFMAKKIFFGVCVDDSSKEARKHTVKLFLHASGSIAARFSYDQVCLPDPVYFNVVTVLQLIPYPYLICPWINEEHVLLHIIVHSRQYNFLIFIPAPASVSWPIFVLIFQSMLPK